MMSTPQPAVKEETPALLIWPKKMAPDHYKAMDAPTLREYLDDGTIGRPPASPERQTSTGYDLPSPGTPHRSSTTAEPARQRLLRRRSRCQRASGLQKEATAWVHLGGAATISFVFCPARGGSHVNNCGCIK